MSKKNISKQSKKASQKLKGEQTAKGKAFYHEDLGVGRIENKKSSFLNRPVIPGMRLTWKAVFLFLFACLIMDLILFALFHWGLGSCYALLCAFE